MHYDYEIECLKTAALMGISLSEFLKMTPKEFYIYLEAYKKNKEDESKEKITLTYLNAMWTIQWLGKKQDRPKPLKEILEGTKPKKTMTDEEMLEKVKILNTMFGGEVR